jgi:hypothetical protein
MSDIVSKYDITPREMARGRNLRLAAIGSPIILTALPAAITLIATLLFTTSPPMAATVLFLGAVITLIGFIKGMLLTGLFSYRYSKWKDATRERIAADGIKAEEIDWFQRELRPAEKRALKDISARDLMLADAYKETLASRLTATRIIKSSKKELNQAERRQLKLRTLKSENLAEFQKQIGRDIEKLGGIHSDAKQMLAEAESRLQMIEAAAARGGGLTDNELALKKLSARSESLPLALEEAKMAEAILEELEREEIAEKEK